MFVFAGEQIILVIGDDYNSTKAKLFCFEDGVQVFDTFEVNVGARGFGHGVGKTQLLGTKMEPMKYEGDKKAPIGIFTLDFIFGYEENLKFKMPYTFAQKDLICVDDSNSDFYNQIIKKPKDMPKSFEEIRRDDGQYELGIVVGHNKKQLKKRGSCIFIHVQKEKDAPTSGCTSMTLEEIKKIASWLDESKNPILLQITKFQLEEALKLYPSLKF
ncbi:MAG: L,D-transpeptidase family protein [Sulfurimonas sp.]|nr:L,D-transpeptidase family protein [Sulfurimonas sp.]